MKTRSIFMHAMLVLALFAAAPAGAARPDADESAVLRRLSGPEAVSVFKRYNAMHGQKIQHHLAVIYGGNPEYIADAGGAMRPLDDSIVGPVTLKWLTKFCREYGIVAADPNFERDVVASLEQVAGIARAYPAWRKILFSEDFEDWINGQPTAERVKSFKTRRSGAASQVNALIEEYLRERRPAPAAKPAAPLELTYSYDPARPGPAVNLKLIGERLKPMAKLPADDEEAFTDSVVENLGGLAIDDDTMALIKHYSRTDNYLLRPELLVRLGREGLPELAVEGLRPLTRGQQYDDLEPFEQAIAQAAKDSQAEGEIIGAMRRLVREARITRYRIPATLADDLAADAPLAPALADLFAGMAKVEYPTQELFDKAQEWQVRRALGMCRSGRRDTGGMLDKEQLAALEVALGNPSGLFEHIRALRAVDRCDVTQQLDANEHAYHVFLAAAPLLDRKMQLQVVHEAASRPRTAGWAKAGCQCGEGEHDGMVVGFLPLWLETGGKQLDFGMLTRIGLYGLTVDDKGGLSRPAGFPETRVTEPIAALMRDAHRHNVKVDWVVGGSDWDAFSRAKKAAKSKLLDTVLFNILQLLERPLEGADNGLVQVASLMRDPGPLSGDGVALYFRKFPRAEKAMFKDFVVKLSDKLKKMTPPRRLSLIVDQDELGPDKTYSYGDLIDVIDGANHLPNKDNTVANRKQMVEDIPVLLMLNEPTQQSKKDLRGGVQDALHGIDSMRLLRDLVTVVEFDGVSTQQLSDDIIYASDNFYGIGFWPLPFAGAAGADSVNTLLAKNFHPTDGVGDIWGRYVGLLCPQRLWLRWVFWITLLMAIGVGGFYFSCRGCNERLDSSGVYFAGTMLLIALPLVALAVLAVSDPLLEPYQSSLMLLFGAGGLAMAAGVSRYYFRKSRRKLP